jgi:hypothetical protein
MLGATTALSTVMGVTLTVAIGGMQWIRAPWSVPITQGVLRTVLAVCCIFTGHLMILFYRTSSWQHSVLCSECPASNHVPKTVIMVGFFWWGVSLCPSRLLPE